MLRDDTRVRYNEFIYGAERDENTHATLYTVCGFQRNRTSTTTNILLWVWVMCPWRVRNLFFFFYFLLKINRRLTRDSVLGISVPPPGHVTSQRTFPRIPPPISVTREIVEFPIPYYTAATRSRDLQITLRRLGRVCSFASSSIVAAFKRRRCNSDRNDFTRRRKQILRARCFIKHKTSQSDSVSV